MEYHLELNTSQHYEAFWIMQVRADIAASFQRVALEHLEDRVARAAGWALEEWPGIKHLVVAGGVAANQLLRSKLQARCCRPTPAWSQHGPTQWFDYAQHIRAWLHRDHHRPRSSKQLYVHRSFGRMADMGVC